MDMTAQCTAGTDGGWSRVLVCWATAEPLSQKQVSQKNQQSAVEN